MKVLHRQMGGAAADACCPLCRRAVARHRLTSRGFQCVQAVVGWCRWPRCAHCRASHPALEVAHLDPKGHGGDHGRRTRADRILLLDAVTHRGADGLEQHGRFVEPLTDRGTDGPCAFYVKHRTPTARGATWQCVGVERSVGVLDSALTARPLPAALELAP